MEACGLSSSFPQLNTFRDLLDECAWLVLDTGPKFPLSVGPIFL